MATLIQYYATGVLRNLSKTLVLRQGLFSPGHPVMALNGLSSPD